MPTVLDLFDASSQRPAVLVEPADPFALASVLVLCVAAVRDVAAYGHDADKVVGEAVQPLVVAAFVDELASR